MSNSLLLNSLFVSSDHAIFPSSGLTFSDGNSEDSNISSIETEVGFFLVCLFSHALLGEAISLSKFRCARSIFFPEMGSITVLAGSLRRAC